MTPELRERFLALGATYRCRADQLKERAARQRAEATALRRAEGLSRPVIMRRPDHRPARPAGRRRAHIARATSSSDPGDDDGPGEPPPPPPDDTQEGRP